jgi:aryl-alcohol dehydrogenase-like predicted oxidoreductase
MCHSLDMAITAWSPLASGILAGKYSREASGESKRLDTIPFHELDEKKLAVARAVDSVADELGVSSAQVALAWVRERGTIPILGVRTLAQLQDNLASLDLNLSIEHLANLEEASAIEKGHPYNFLDRPMVNALVFGGMGELIDNHRH